MLFNESALLIETGSYKRFDKIILITASQDVKIKRLIQRENVSKEEIRLRMNSQLSDEVKQYHADYIIENNETDFLLPKIFTIIDQLKKESLTL